MNEQGELVKSFKASKAGRLKLIQTNSGVKTVSELQTGEDLLNTVFENGELKNTQTFEEIRKRATLPQLINTTT